MTRAIYLRTSCSLSGEAKKKISQNAPAHAFDFTWQRAQLVATGSDISSGALLHYFSVSFTQHSCWVTVTTVFTENLPRRAVMNVEVSR